MNLAASVEKKRRGERKCSRQALRFLVKTMAAVELSSYGNEFPFIYWFLQGRKTMALFKARIHSPIGEVGQA